MASAFARCASRGLFARDSAAIDTHTRSGASFTVPSPVVTMTGSPGGGGACAPAGTTPEHDKTATRIKGRNTGTSSTFDTKGQRPYTVHTILNPIPYEYVSGGTLWRWLHESIRTSDTSQLPPRSRRIDPEIGPGGDANGEVA